MNRQFRKQFAAKSKDLSFSEAKKLAGLWVTFWPGPMTAEEETLSRSLVEKHRHKEMYHGGVSGLAVGDMLMPPKLTGMDPRGHGDTVPNRKTHVFLTTHIEVADLYAKLIGGSVYQVEPLGALMADEISIRAERLMSEHPERKKLVSRIDLKCDRARILAVLS